MKTMNASESKHTPGPWKHIKPESYDATPLPVAARDGFRVAWVNPYAATNGDGVDTCNARLIAAAPELLEALERMLKFADGFTQCSAGQPDAKQQARAAIAKATP